VAKKHRPKKGSRGYSPRKRAAKTNTHIRSWPEDNGSEPKVQGFAGFKCGMTHAMIVDYRPHSKTSGQEVHVPVTVLEVPPVKVVGVRVYDSNAYGLQTAGEVWTSKLGKDIKKHLAHTQIPKTKQSWSKFKDVDIEEVRILAYTQPYLVKSVPKKQPDLLEIKVGGGSVEEKLEFAKGLIGKDLKIEDFAKEGHMVDVIAITRGKGFQGHVKRWGVKLLTHKNSKHRRMIGTLGPWNPSYVMPTVPQAGQTGYYQRTEYNKRIVKIGDKGDEITPNGGFLHYGEVSNPYIVVHGSVPGTPKRLIRLRDPTRRRGAVLEEKPKITYISTESKQG
jgi:large subunit ribosomal protein L3